MPRRSAVIDHPQRARIEELILAGRARTSIAAEIGVPYPAVERHAQRLLADRARGTAGSDGGEALDPVATFSAAFGREPTAYQAALLADERSTIVLKSRQSGFTQAAAALAIWRARSRPGADSVIISPSLSQSKEVTTRARHGLYQLEEDLVQDASGLLRLKNASRIISLPGNARAVRGYAPALVIVDEAAWVPDTTYDATRPLLAASHGRLVAQSTPGFQTGWFHALWQSTLGDDWLRLEVPASAVPFIDPDFLERERRELLPEVYASEYGCIFGSGLAGATLFDPDTFDALLVDEEAS